MTAQKIAEMVIRMLGMEEVSPQTVLNAINDVYKILWENEAPFVPLKSLTQELLLSWRNRIALVYGTAALVCLDCNDDGGDYERYLELYMRALHHEGAAG